MFCSVTATPDRTLVPEDLSTTSSTPFAGCTTPAPTAGPGSILDSTATAGRGSSAIPNVHTADSVWALNDVQETKRFSLTVAYL